MASNKKYWSSFDELQNTTAAQEALSSEFTRTGEQSVDSFLSDSRLNESNTGRRDFLKFMGFGLAAATLAACETPVVKSIPYVVKPEEITPGVANFYASTYYDGNDYGNLLVKTREGRPIFIKGNKSYGIASGSLNSRMNASVLELYDGARLKGPKKAGADTDWASLDGEVKAALSAASSIRILSGTVISPSTQRAINELSNKYTGKVKHIQYDTISYAGLAKANGGSVPAYDFSKAKTIVSIAADFLGTWVMPAAFTGQYSQTRKPENGWMSKHYQFESNMSLTGSNADHRTPIRPSQEGLVAAALYAAVTGGSPVSVEGADMTIKRAADDLKANAGASLVVAGSNDPQIQTIVAAINSALGNVGVTVDTRNGINLFKGDDTQMTQLVDEMNNGSVDVLIVYGTNPAYSWIDSEKFVAGLQKVKTSVSFNLFADETGSRCTYMAPDHHYLESWNDYTPMKGRTDLAQPTISPLYNTRYAQESLLRWADNNASYYDYIRQTHNGAYSAAMMKTDAAWNVAVHNGTFSEQTAAATVQVAAAATAASAEAPATETPAADAAPVAISAAPLNVNDAINYVTSIKGGEWELSLYQKVTMGAGNHANNAMLQETPDPITKVTWDNYVTMAPSDMKEMGLETYIGQCDCASLVKVTVGDKSIVLPAYPTPGQKSRTIGIALGYGRGAGNEEIGKAAFQTGREGVHLMNGSNRETIGKNAYPLASISNGVVSYNVPSVSIAAEAGSYSIATTQMHSTVMGRDSVVKETTISTFLKEKEKKKGEASYNKAVTLPVHADVNKDGSIDVNDRQHVREVDLWRDHPVEGVGHRWGLTIDLTSCFGCGACITACHTENNVPVVGKDEVLRHRDMHWLRIDRYFSSAQDTLKETKEANNVGTIGAYRLMENPEENPQTVHMPMMCQHCNHAPCETVCPVAATVHSNEGLNNMAYNRCIGTRYCANNCPYKVRRFNWFNYVTNDKFAMVNPAQDDQLRWVLNPDVTVRTRGVMEKCSMCQQRIQSGKTEAKRNGTIVIDGSIQTACAEACPTNAIVFGDLNDTTSQNKKRSESVRSYHALEEVGIQPNIFYMTKVRNIEESEA
jgi:molybdopterin-containing oxidoreductase family iron-sulfur binding subunit